MSYSDNPLAVEARERRAALRAAGLCTCGRVDVPNGGLCPGCRLYHRRRVNQGLNRCSRCRELGHTLPTCPVTPLEACRRALAELGREVVTGCSIAQRMGAKHISDQVAPCIEAARAAGLLVVHRVRAVRGQSERVWYRVTERKLFADVGRPPAKARSGKSP